MTPTDKTAREAAEKWQEEYLTKHDYEEYDCTRDEAFLAGFHSRDAEIEALSADKNKFDQEARQYSELRLEAEARTEWARAELVRERSKNMVDMANADQEIHALRKVRDEVKNIDREMTDCGRCMVIYDTLAATEGKP